MASEVLGKHSTEAAGLPTIDNDPSRGRALEKILLDVLELHDGLCMDDERDRQILAVALTRTLNGWMDIEKTGTARPDT